MSEGPGDILVFCSGEREIRDAADALKKLKLPRATDSLEVLPLYARLSAAEQHRVFAPHQTRRVVLATNVAETSLTVPGIHYVVDTGLARISRFSPRTKVQRLPIEPISQASANQRTGRCGRVAAGICIRLYAEEDFAGRPEFTEPEILRTNLASVILQMTALNLGDVARFPFVEPPDTRSVAAGMQLLDEIGAITTEPERRGHRGRGRRRDERPRAGHRLTRLGRQLVRLPIDPRLGRMMVEASRHDCLREVVTVVAALSMQDPRERPSDQQELADQKHRRFADAASDFAGLLNLWRYVKEQQKELSSSAFRRMCRAEFLNYLRIREWQDLDSQLRQVAKQLDLPLNKQPAAADAIHQALLAGMLSHIGSKDEEKRDYQGARGTRFAIFPGSALFKKQPPFVMAAELVETSRLWGRMNARIEPEWAEEAGAHLVKRSYSEPHWSKRRGAVMAYEKVTLYGVPIVVDRRVNYGRIDQEAAREIFVRHALVQGEWETHHRFYAANRRMLEEAEELEHRARRRDIVVDDETIFDFYDARVPPEVVSKAHFDSWWKKERHAHPDLLTFPADLLTHDRAETVSTADFPDVWRHQDTDLPLDYHFEPGTEHDGVTVDIPVSTLNQVESEDFSWPVPGLRQELVVALIRSLPKALRVNFVPAPNHARAFLDATTPGEEPLIDALERHLRRTTGVVVAREDWDLAKIPAHLRLSFRVVDDAGAVLGAGKDLAALRAGLRSTSDTAIARAGASVERSGLTTWDFDELPRTFVVTRAGHEVRGFPALVVERHTGDDTASVAIRVLATEAEQAAATWVGTRWLLAHAVPSPAARLVDELDNQEKLALGLAPHRTTKDLLDDAYAAAVDAIMTEQGDQVWDRAGFDRLVDAVRRDGESRTREVVALLTTVLPQAHEVMRLLSGRAELALLPALSDLKGQWERLFPEGFVADSGVRALRGYPRYLTAMATRHDKLARDPRRDAVLMGTVAPLQQAYLDRVAAIPDGLSEGESLRAIRWMVEELRVSLWAQQLTTAYPSSATRIDKALRDL
jgi:ATP-dependent helicase HrpA